MRTVQSNGRTLALPTVWPTVGVVDLLHANSLQVSSFDPSTLVILVAVVIVAVFVVVVVMVVFSKALCANRDETSNS